MRSTLDPFHDTSSTPDRKRDQVEGGERSVLLLNGEARDMPERAPPAVRRPDHRSSSGRSEPEEHKSRRRPRGNGMRHRIPGQAHAPQHQKDADRRTANDNTAIRESALHEAHSADGPMRSSYMTATL